MIFHSRILNGLSGAFLFSLANVVASFLIFPVILKNVSMEISGIWFLFLTIGIWVNLLDLGISPTISREIGFIVGNLSIDSSLRNLKISRLIATADFLFFRIGFLLLFLLVGIGCYVIYKKTSVDYVWQVQCAWIIFSIGATINILNSSSFAILIGMGQVGIERSLRSFSTIASFMLSFLFLDSGFGIIGLSFSWLIQSLVNFVALKKIINNTYSHLIGNIPDVNIQDLKKIIFPSLRWAVMSLGALLILQTDNFVIATVLNVDLIPRYEAAAKVALISLSISSVFSIAISPHISSNYASGNFDEARSLILSSVKISLFLAVFVTSYLFVFGDVLIHLWIGKDNFVGISIFYIFLAIALLEAHHVLLATATMATGELAFTVTAVIAAFLNLFLSIFLAKHIGLIGVTLGTLISQLVTNNWYVPYVTLRRFKISFSYYYRTVLIPLVLMLGFFVLSCKAIKVILIGHDEKLLIGASFVIHIFIALLTTSIFMGNSTRFMFLRYIKSFLIDRKN